ncbi:RNA exonuclease 5 [Genypterus blacodes]|uniref:RNA exonuclease 5 n=1 Tax=Genypterus blacodes TaxID=154954 RepID=UPI003F768AE1
MEPSHSRKRRKDNASATQGDVKRLKTETKGENVSHCSHRLHTPRISVLRDHQQPMTQDELMELLHFAALGKAGGIGQPSWCRLHHQRKVKAVNVVVVEGLTQSHFYKHYLTLQHLRTHYSTRVSFTPPSNNLTSEIFSREVHEWDGSPGSQTEQESRPLHKVPNWHPVISKFGTKRRGPTAYVLTQEEMIKKRYPVKGMPGFEDFVCTDSDACVSDSSPLYGLDCEMCLTERGNELARVSLVDSDGKCMLDELVKPQNRIINYLTRFSGITAAMLQPITTTLREVQVKLRKLLPRDAVLVGHSIDNDLIALKLNHPHVIDTSLLYRKEFGQKFKLKVLAETVLQRQIQTADRRGHNPTEDAVAALELAQYFVKTGPLQVVERHLEELWGGYTVDLNESNLCGVAPTLSNRFADRLQKHGRSIAYLGKRGDVELDLSHQQWHNSDKELLASFRRQTTFPFFSVLRLSSVLDQVNNSSSHQERHYQRVCGSLRDARMVFAGPFSAGFSEKDVSRLFRCCGPVQKVKMLKTVARIHAEIEFELLEGALLALKTLNGLKVQGQTIKVQRPVNESMLDLDLTLDALMGDKINTNQLYAVKFNPHMTNCIQISAKSSLDATFVHHAKVNGLKLDACIPGLPHGVEESSVAKQRRPTSSKLTEEMLRETFGIFGKVERIVLPTKPGKRARYACIKFDSSEAVCAALNASEDLWKEKYVICPSLTPPHLHSWVTATTATTPKDSEGEAVNGETLMHTSPQDQDMEDVMRRLDHRLGKLFRSLPECTLSVVVLQTSTRSHLPGLCLIEVKQDLLEPATPFTLGTSANGTPARTSQSNGT